MYYAGVFKQIEKVLRENMLPVFRSEAIFKKLTGIKALKNAVATRGALIMFCMELSAASETMLLLSNQTNFSEKTIKKLFGKIKVALSIGNKNVDTLEYLNISEINATFPQAYLLDDEKRAKIQTLKGIMLNAVNSLHDTSIANQLVSTAADRENDIDIDISKEEQENLFDCLGEAKALIKSFDEQITGLHESPVSQVYTPLPLMIFTLESHGRQHLSEIKNFTYQLQGAANGKNVVFVVGEPDALSIRINLALIYLYALKNIRKFLLSTDPTKEVLLPELQNKKLLLQKEFNSKFKRIINNLNTLTIETKLAGVLKTDKETIDTHVTVNDTKSEPSPQNTAVSTITIAAKPTVNIIVIGWDIKVEDLPVIDCVAYTLINNHKILLTEAAVAHEILEMEYLLKNVSAAFHDTPRHLVLLPDISTKIDLEIHLKAADEDKSALEKRIQDFIADLHSKPFSFATNGELVAVNNLILETINPALSNLQQALVSTDESDDNLSTLTSQLNLINKNLNNALKLFNKFVHFHASYEHKGYMLLRDNQNLRNKLDSLKLALAEIEESHAQLSKESWPQRKSQQPLLEITSGVTTAKEHLNRASIFLDDSATLLNDSNKFNEVENKLKSCVDCFEKFTLLSKTIKEDIIKETLFFSNNEVRRFGDNPHRLQLYTRTSSSPSLPEVEEKKFASPR